MNSTLAAGDPDINPEGVEGAVERDVPEIFERCRKLIAERRENLTDDLTTVLGQCRGGRRRSSRSTRS